MGIKEGDKVKVEYTGLLEDGTVFDSTEKSGEPLEFKVGEGKIIKGFEKNIIGMEKGEEKEFSLESSESYGEHNPELIKEFPKDQLPKEAKVDSVLLVNTPDGNQIPAKVMEIDEEKAKIDLNHPLAGKKIKFKVKIIDINSE